jgi:predicted nucleotidyltransferase
LSLFGSVLREDFDPERSDVDLLAEFHPQALRDSGWGYYLYGEELGEILGRKVDFCTHLRSWLQPLVEKHALPIYDAATVSVAELHAHLDAAIAQMPPFES